MRRLQKLELEKAFIMALAGSGDDYTVNFLVDDSIEVINSSSIRECSNSGAEPESISATTFSRYRILFSE